MVLVFARVFAWLAALPYAFVALLVLTGGTTWSASSGLTNIPSAHGQPRSTVVLLAR